MIDRRRRTRDAEARAKELLARARVQAKPATPRMARPNVDVGATVGGGEQEIPNAKRSRTITRNATVVIDAIAGGGEGVGRVDGMAAFIPRTAPGDVVDAALVVHGRYARGRVNAVITASPDRVQPQCVHYDGDECGGCQLQHVSATAQLYAKARVVRDTLARIGRRQVDIPSIIASPSQWEYRQKLTLSLSRNAEGSWVGGLHRLGRPDEIFALVECRISAPELVTAWHAVHRLQQLLPNGNTLRITFRLAPGARAANSVAVTVVGGNSWPHARDFVKAIAADHAVSLAALWWTSDDGHRAELVSPNNDAESTAANFVQANAELAPALHAYAVNAALGFSPRRALDAYAGTGALALDMSQHGVAVAAIEWDRSAVALMRERLPVESLVYDSSVEGVIDRALVEAGPLDVVILNPPRVGAHRDVTTALDAAASHGMRAIVYVSCDPATLARDLSRLPAWRIQSLQCFDMFPQTAHVETVCVLIPENA